MAWPKKVPILAPSDICKGRFDDRAGRHCIVGWVRAVFDSRHHKNVIDELRAITRTYYLPNFNDTNKSRKVADAWNVAMHNLGYTEPCER